MKKDRKHLFKQERRRLYRYRCPGSMCNAGDCACRTRVSGIYCETSA